MANLLDLYKAQLVHVHALLLKELNINSFEDDENWETLESALLLLKDLRYIAGASDSEEDRLLDLRVLQPSQTSMKEGIATDIQAWEAAE